MEELIDIYDVNKNKTGKVENRHTYKLKKGEYYLVSDAIIINSKNEILLTRRAQNKINGLLWEGVGGCTIAGETQIDTILREIKEEIGVAFTKKEAILFKEIRRDEELTSRFKEIFIFRKDIDLKDIQLQKEEVIDAKWVTIDEFMNMYEKNELIPTLDFNKEDYEKAINIKQRESYSYIGKIVNVKIDRKLNTLHPKHGFKYEVNYGYIPNTVSGDGEELDAYVLGVNEPIDSFIGKCIAVIHRTNDDDDKLIVVPEGKEFSDEEMRKFTNFQEKYFESEIIR